jgi:hypothetical protein
VLANTHIRPNNAIFDFGGGWNINWWNDDVVYLSGIEYKKVYLRPEYKKLK